MPNALTHNEARQKVCIWCGKYKKDVRKITASVQSLLDCKIPSQIPAKPEDDVRLPSGIWVLLDLRGPLQKINKT